jgi:hypothetical protein
LLFLRRSPRTPPADYPLRVAAHSTTPPSLAALQDDDGALNATAVAGNGALSVILGVPFRGAVQTIPSQTVPADHVIKIDSRRTPEEIAALEPKTSSAAKTPRNSDAFKAMPQGPFVTKDAAKNAFTSFARQTGYDIPSGPFWTAARPPGTRHGAQGTLACVHSKRPALSKSTGVRASAPAEVSGDCCCVYKAVSWRAGGGSGGGGAGWRAGVA